LPDFLTPFCVIRQDLALKALIEFENDEHLSVAAKEQIAQKLGCIDLRTVNKHIQAIAGKINTAQNEIYSFLSLQCCPLPALKPSINSSNRALILIEHLKDQLYKIRGRIIPEFLFTLFGFISHLDHYKNFSMTYASRNRNYWDTS